MSGEPLVIDETVEDDVEAEAVDFPAWADEDTQIRAFVLQYYGPAADLDARIYLKNCQDVAAWIKTGVLPPDPVEKPTKRKPIHLTPIPTEKS